MRRLVLIGCVALSGCFYAPTVADCAVACTDTCPTGLSCIEGLCRKNDQVSCECQTGTERLCGITRGQCRQGTQTCAAGAWGACAGEVTGTPEVCDGFDNDCDGLTDQSAPVVLVEGLTRDWKFVSLAAGYALVTTEQTDAGEDATIVRALGVNFEPLDVTTARVGPRTLNEAAGINATVYLAWAFDGGLQLGQVVSGQFTSLEAVEDAGVGLRMRLAVNDERVVAHWDQPGAPSTRLARWTLGGQLTDVTDFATLDSGVPLSDGFTSTLSSRGHYAVFTATDPGDAGFTENPHVVVNTSTLRIVRLNAPYYQYEFNDSHMVELPNGAVSLVYTYVYPSSSWSGIYLNPDILQLKTADELIVEEVMSNALAWGSSDAVADSQGRVSFVYMDNVARRLVMGRSVGTGRLSTAPAKRAQLSSDGFGVPRLGAPAPDGFLPLVWNDNVRITAKRICPVR